MDEHPTDGPPSPSRVFQVSTNALPQRQSVMSILPSHSSLDSPNGRNDTSPGVLQRKKNSFEKSHSMRLVKMESIKGPSWKSESSPASVRRISTGLNENIADSPSTAGSVMSDYNDNSFLDESSLDMVDEELENAILQIAEKENGMLKVVYKLNRQEGCIRLEREIYNKYFHLLSQGFLKWTSYVRSCNSTYMESDKQRWHLHALCNQSNDLQAWYHGTFHQEVYRLRGPFWYKDAMLPAYKETYDVIDNCLTPAEEEALAHVLCSSDTTYGDVSSHMFVIESMLNDNSLYQLFLKLTSTGLQITKYPRSGRPARKTFRVSFVEGKIYLTWKGKFGNQGVDLGDVTEVLPGIQTEILKKSAHSGRADQYLSLICAGRSVDLYFDDDDDRNSTFKLLEVLIRKEKNNLTEFGYVYPTPDSDLVHWMSYKESFGIAKIPVHVLRKIDEKQLKDDFDDKMLKEMDAHSAYAARDLEDKLNRMLKV